jgi:hypothetical protein
MNSVHRPETTVRAAGNSIHPRYRRLKWSSAERWPFACIRMQEELLWPCSTLICHQEHFTDLKNLKTGNLNYGKTADC